MTKVFLNCYLTNNDRGKTRKPIDKTVHPKDERRRGGKKLNVSKLVEEITWLSGESTRAQTAGAVGRSITHGTPRHGGRGWRA